MKSFLLRLFLLFLCDEFAKCERDYIISEVPEDNDYEKIERGQPPHSGIHPTPSYSVHPLDPLTRDEILCTTKTITAKCPDCIFINIQLKEPAKDSMKTYFLNDIHPRREDVPRQSFSVTLNKFGKATEWVVDIKPNCHGGSFRRADLAKGVQPVITVQDYTDSEEITKKNEIFKERCKKLGYTDMDLVYATDWSMGYISPNETKYIGKRLVLMLVYGLQYPNDNPYAHPFDFMVVVDLIAREVVEFINCPTGFGFDTNNSHVTVPTKSYNYDQDFFKGLLRKDIKPIEISSPHGVSFTVHGYQIKWQKYTFRIGFNAREGLVLHWITYTDAGKLRPLFYRLSVSELWIPYGDPRPPFPRKQPFDEGEYNLGNETLTLVPHEDCLGNAHYFDAFLNDNSGLPIEFRRCVCIYEEDAGILWKHEDEVSGKTTTVRSRRLVVSFSMQSGNYNYIFYWYFYQDASIQFEVKLTGIMSTNLVAAGVEPPPYGVLVAPQVFAQFHQHIFCVRMDFDCNGFNNSVMTSEFVTPPVNKMNPQGNAILSKVTLLKTAGEGRTKNSATTARVWKISNPSIKTPIQNKPVSYVLKSDNSAPAFWKSGVPSKFRAGFADYDVWVTPYNDQQIYAPGDYINGNGLPQWVENDVNTSIVNKDIVVWHVFGLSHYPRYEDFPVMPVESSGFWLRPSGFFTQNPAWDVPNAKIQNNKSAI